MDLKILEKQIKLLKSRKSKNFYILTGEELGVINAFIKQISVTYKADIQRVDTVAEIWPKLLTKSPLVKSNSLYVVKDDLDFLKSDLWNNDGLNKIKYNKLVLILTKLDKRSKFVKTYNKEFIEFKKLSNTQLTSLVLNTLEMKEREAEYLVNRCECDYSRILNELDKLKRLNLKPGEYKKAIDYIISVEYDFTIFDFIDFVCSGDINNSVLALNVLLDRGESIIGMITLLYNQFKQGLMIYDYLDMTTQVIAKRTGVNPFIIDKLRNSICVTYSQKEMIERMLLLVNIDKGIKTGLYDDKIAIQYALLKILVVNT